jgi:hypothetical protein
MRKYLATTRGRRRAIAITTFNILTITGFSIAGLIAPKALMPTGFEPNEATMIFAMYDVARTLPMAVLVFASILFSSASGLIVLGTMAGLIQFSDAAVGLFQHDLLKTLVPLALACLQVYALIVFEKALRAEAPPKRLRSKSGKFA